MKLDTILVLKAHFDGMRSFDKLKMTMCNTVKVQHGNQI